MAVIFKEAITSEEVKQVYDLFLSCSLAVKQSSFFNWSAETIQSELKTARCFGLWKPVDFKGASVSQDKADKEAQAFELFELEAFIIFRDSGDVWEITALGTKPSIQNQGLMSLHLSQFLLKYRNASKGVQVEVHEQNEAAIRVYTKLGFEITRRRRNYYSDGAQALVMMNLIG